MTTKDLITISMSREAQDYVKNFLKTLKPVKKSFSSFLTESAVEKIKRMQEKNERAIK